MENQEPTVDEKIAQTAYEAGSALFSFMELQKEKAAIEQKMKFYSDRMEALRKLKEQLDVEKANGAVPNSAS